MPIATVNCRCPISPPATLVTSKFDCCYCISLPSCCCPMPLPLNIATNVATAIKHPCHHLHWTPFLSSAATTAAAAAATAAPQPSPHPPPPPLLNSPLSIAKERGNSSTTISVPMAAPTWKRLLVQTTWTYLTFVWSVWCWLREFSHYQVVSLEKLYLFTIYILGDDSPCIFGRWWGLHGSEYHRTHILGNTDKRNDVKRYCTYN